MQDDMPDPPVASPKVRAAERIEQLRQPTSRAVLTTSGANVAMAALGGLGGLVLARGLGPTDRGDLVVVVLWPTVLVVVGSLGVTAATTFFVAKDAENKAAITATATWCAAAIGSAIALVGAVALAPLIARNNEVHLALALSFLLAPILIVGPVLQAALRAVDFKLWNAARLVQPVVYLVLVVALFAAGRLTVLTATGGFAISVVAQLILGGVLARRRIGALKGASWEHVRQLYSYGPKVAISTLPDLVNVQLDQLVLSVLPAVTAARLGNYAVAVSMATLALPVAVAAGYVAFPLVAAADSEATRRRMERKALGFAAITAAGAAGLIALLAAAVVPVVFGDGYRPAVACVWLLAPGIVCLALGRVAGEILNGRNRPLRVAAAQTIGAVVTVVALAILVPSYGIKGAAATSSVAYFIVLVILLRGLQVARAAEA